MVWVTVCRTGRGERTVCDTLHGSIYAGFDVCTAYACRTASETWFVKTLYDTTDQRKHIETFKTDITFLLEAKTRHGHRGRCASPHEWHLRQSRHT